jgi:hypothetical protein
MSSELTKKQKKQQIARILEIKKKRDYEREERQAEELKELFNEIENYKYTTTTTSFDTFILELCKKYSINVLKKYVEDFSLKKIILDKEYINNIILDEEYKRIKITEIYKDWLNDNNNRSFEEFLDSLNLKLPPGYFPSDIKDTINKYHNWLKTRDDKDTYTINNYQNWLKTKNKDKLLNLLKVFLKRVDKDECFKLLQKRNNEGLNGADLLKATHCEEIYIYEGIKAYIAYIESSNSDRSNSDRSESSKFGISPKEVVSGGTSRRRRTNKKRRKTRK